MSGLSQAFLYLGFALYIFSVIAVERDRSDTVETLERPKVSFWDFYPGMILGFGVWPFLRPMKNPFSFLAAISGVALVILSISL